MTLVLLSSVAAYALFVASRPIRPDIAADLGDLAPPFQTAIQAPFRIHPGHDNPKHDAARFHTQIPTQLIAYLSEPDEEHIAAIPLFEAPLDDTLGVQNGFSVADHLADEPVVLEPTDDMSSAPLVVLAFSCVAAFLALACVALTLYIVNRLRSQMLASKRVWELFPRFWHRPRSPVPQENASITAKDRLSGDHPLVLQTWVEPQHLRQAEQESAERHNVHAPQDKLLYFDTLSDMESDGDDADEKYQDALDRTPLPPIHELPLSEHASSESHLGDPHLLASDAHPLDQPTSDRSTPLMREWSSSRPAWSVRAIDSPALGLSAREGDGGDGVNSTSQALVHSRRRAYRSIVPEFDVALAMQLRPGLGLGADPAWMVRFLMTIFGWFAVALTSNSARQTHL